MSTFLDYVQVWSMHEFGMYVPDPKVGRQTLLSALNLLTLIYMCF